MGSARWGPPGSQKNRPAKAGNFATGHASLFYFIFFEKSGGSGHTPAAGEPGSL
jgi:hypothetical protein